MSDYVSLALSFFVRGKSGQVSLNIIVSLLSNTHPNCPSNVWICCYMLNKSCYRMVTLNVVMYKTAHITMMNLPGGFVCTLSMSP